MSAVAHDFQTDTSFSGQFSWAGYLLGFSLGGFFDGILLHQVLQWHHLLSALEGDGFRDLQVQILADGLFHLLMYLIAFGGLWGLWKARREYAQPKADRFLLANALIGFGVWHVVDGILSHWVLGIHRIRMDSANPLLWDLLWFFLFGVAVIVVGYLLRRGAHPSGPGLHKAPLVLALAVLISGPIAAMPPPGINSVLVIAKPGAKPGQIFNGIVAANSGIVWSDRSGRFWVVKLGKNADPGALYDDGALWVTQSSLAFSCLAWSRAPET